MFHLHVARGGKGKEGMGREGGRESANPRFLIIFRHELCAVRGRGQWFCNEYHVGGGGCGLLQLVVLDGGPN